MTDQYAPYLIEFANVEQQREWLLNHPRDEWHFIYIGTSGRTPHKPSNTRIGCNKCDRPTWVGVDAEKTMTSRGWVVFLILCEYCGHNPPRWTKTTRRPYRQDVNEQRLVLYSATINIIMWLASWGRKAT